MKRTLLFALLLIYISASQKIIAQDKKPLTGFVDMHTHPRSDLAFGGELFYGAPCGNIAEALKNCEADHAAFSLSNTLGNIFRYKLVEQTEGMACKDWKHLNKGYPDFAAWPVHCSVLHQQMWVDWIERAHQGGLNIMVALATSNHCIADAAETSGPNDDKSNMDAALRGIHELVACSRFMEVARTPADVRRIVGDGKLAVIVGVEMDNIGNFYDPADHKDAAYNPNPTDQDIEAELDRLWRWDVRYIFPVHLTNNVMGGAAIYIPAFNVPNKYNTGSEFKPELVSTQESGIAFTLEHPVISTDPEADLIAKIVFRIVGGIMPEGVNPSRRSNYTFWQKKEGMGYRNSLGLTDRGRKAIKYMMSKGFLIDIDHMSEKMATEVLDIAVQNDYPVNSGHNGLRGNAGNENGRTIKQYAQILQVGGMVGLGHGDVASNFVRGFREVLPLMKGKNLAIGTDVNGFYPLPRPDQKALITYDNTLTRCTTGNKTWDINTDGMAHYGLFPDYIRSWEAAGMTKEEEKAFMTSAEYFTQMWEKCEKTKSKISQ